MNIGLQTALTNEEMRARPYTDEETPTDPSEVTSDTPLTDLNLNWKEKDLPERERTKHVHRLHPYLGKYIPQIVEIFLRKYFKKGQTVLDPFSGSGTTLVQAKELGINSVGCDISAFNVMLAEAKTKKYFIQSVKEEVGDVLSKVRTATIDSLDQGVLQLGTSCLKNKNTESSEYLKSWFAPQALFELLTFRDLICKYENQDILKIILSRSARSSRLTTHFDLDFPKKPQTEPYYCYKHSRTCKPTQTAFRFLKRYGEDTIRRIEEYSRINTNATVRVIHGDSRAVNPDFVDGVITSPPYVGLIDYHEQHRYAYELLGMEDRSEDEIGRPATGTGIKAKNIYEDLLVEVFQNILKYVPSGAPLIVIAGDKHNLYPDVAARCDVYQESVIKRHVNRRTGRRSGEFYESVFVWKKK